MGQVNIWSTTADQESFMVLKVASAQNTITATGLKPMITYAANILVANSKFNSTVSPAVKFTTPEGRKSFIDILSICVDIEKSFTAPGPITNFEVEPVGCHAVLCTWNEPEQNLGNLSAYRLEFFGTVL